MFIDRIKVQVRGGKGGNGSVSFRREKFVPKGGPDGGDGGDGGSVIFKATEDYQNLNHLYYMPHYAGENGEQGRGKKCHGKSGRDTMVKVPVGTVIHDETGTTTIADLNHVDAEYVVAKAGHGGRGNVHFKGPEEQVPRHAEEGTEGEDKTLLIELKTVADIGLVGYPNAGKSTLIRTLSNARPKAAPYPFTTLTPNVGIVTFTDFFRFSIADVPGLIDGAHNNVGLGHDFLRHIERCPILVYVIDTAGVDNRNPCEDLRSLKKELELHQKGLTDRPSIVIANKTDLAEAAENIDELKNEADPLKVIPASAINKDNINYLKQQLRQQLESVTIANT